MTNSSSLVITVVISANACVFHSTNWQPRAGSVRFGTRKKGFEAIHEEKGFRSETLRQQLCTK